MGNFIEYLAIAINFGLPIVVIVLVMIYVSNKVKLFETKLDRIISLLEEIKQDSNK